MAELKPYPHHPYADLFPMMEPAEFKEHADDVEANGLYDDIWLLDGKVLDGRNRQKACFERGAEPRYKEYKGRDPLGFVISKNLRRRHLNESQRALVAARMADAKKGGQAAGEAATSTKSAAKKLKVSPSLVKTAKTVLKKGAAELVAAVDKGELTASAAAEAAKLPKAEQEKLLKDGPEKVKEHAAQARANKPVQTRPMPHETPRGTAKRKPARGLGGEKFTFAVIDRAYGPLVRAVDEMAAAHDVKDGRSHKTALEKLDDLLSYLKTWHNREQKKDSE